MAASSSHRPFKLSNQLQGHQGDVRALASYAPSNAKSSVLLSASRDKTACVWSRIHGQRSFEPPEVLGGHGGYVNSCAWLSNGHGELYALTGGQDKLINAFAVQVADDGRAIASRNATYTLVGHQDNISTLDVGPGGSYVVSGSWDKTARIWKNWQCAAVLEGHLQAVWAVLAVDEDRVITASADKMIRLWSISNPKEPIAIFGGHGDAVRGLKLIRGGKAFASCSNDGTINVFNLENLNSRGHNQPISSMSGHTSFVYSLAELGGAELASSGEDRSVRVWKDNGDLGQTITIPAISVWTVAAFGDGDLACGSSDCFIRIFTRDESRLADASETEAYEQAVSSQALNKTQVGDVRKDQVPGKEALAQPGKKEGETKMVSNGGMIEAYQWSSGSGQWEKVGEVVGGVGSGQKKLHEGKEYDYVFDVDVADGVPPLKLPYNLSDNPYAAAQRFLERYELPPSYLEQIVQFIDKNTEGVSIGAGQQPHSDPYSGMGRYIPGQDSAPAPAATQSGPNLSILPVMAPQSFRQANLQALQSKTKDLSAASSPQVDVSAAISDLEAALQKGQSSQPINLTSVAPALTAWPASSRFPLLDLVRLSALFPTSPKAQDMLPQLLQSAEWHSDWPTSTDSIKARETNTMLAARAIANMFSSSPGRDYLVNKGQSVLGEPGLPGSVRTTNFTHLNKNGRIAYATILFNFSTSVVSGNASDAANWANVLLDAIVQVLTEEPAGEEEVIYRALVALGNLTYAASSKQSGTSSSGVSSSLPVGTIQLARDAAEAWGERLAGAKRVQEVLGEIKQL